MKVDAPRAQDFSDWDGTPFFEGYPSEGRRVYIVMSEEGARFEAYGRLDGSNEDLFKVQGRGEERERFLEVVRGEGAAVTYELPPYDTGTGGDKGASSGTKPGRSETR